MKAGPLKVPIIDSYGYQGASSLAAPMRLKGWRDFSFKQSSHVLL
jgi:hypothetical protein